MGKENDTNTRQPITAAMRAAFKANAPAALRRRSNGYLLGTAMNVGQWLVIASFALLGIYHWGWTPTHLFVVLVAGVVMAIVADTIKWLLARARMRADYQKMLDDRLVWQMVTAMQWGRDDIEQGSKQGPGAAIALDLLVGAVAIWLLLKQWQAVGGTSDELLASGSGLRGALIAVCAAPVFSLIAAMVAGQSKEGGHDDLEFRAGGRGIGLMLLAAAFWFLGNNPEAARSLMIFINGATVVLGIIGILGAWIMYREREWLRRHLQESIETKPSMSSNRKRSKRS